jgi:cytochrome c oxidase subunit 2
MKRGLVGLIVLTVFELLMNAGCFEQVLEEEKGGFKKTFSSNGERIFFTGISERTGRIEIREGPLWLRTHGGGCVICHGSRGRGGINVMDSAVSADIRYRSLTSADHDHKGEKGGHSLYNDELLKRAITEGLNAEGEPLHWTMPRWVMDERDLDDLINYLKVVK